MIRQILAQPTHGLVSHVGRTHQVSRQTLSRWTARGRQALEEAWGKPTVSVKHPSSLPTLVLTLLIETHASSRGMQASLKSLHGIDLRLGTIAGIVKEAGRRAQAWLEQHQSAMPRPLALDEQDSSQRGKASVNVSDVHSGHVWASIPPVKVDGDRWTVVLWSVQEQGVRRLGTVSDGGRAIQQALRHVVGEARHQRDVWHLFHLAAQVQGRLERAVKAERERLDVIQQQAEDNAQGKRRRGRRPKATLSEQQALLTQMTSVAEGVRDLCQELHTVLEVVVPHGDLVLNSSQRQDEIEALLALLDELAPLALPALQGQIQMLSKQIRLALPQALLCARRLDAMQEQASQALGPEAVALLVWAWLRRACLARPVSICCKAFTPPGKRSHPSFWLPGITRSEPGAQWNIGTALFGLMWLFIALFLRVSSRCSPCGIITGWLLVDFMRDSLRSNEQDQLHLIQRGWQLWALLLSLPDRSHVSHGFEPCQVCTHGSRPCGRNPKILRDG